MSYLDKVIGHKFQKEQLLRQFHSGTLPHALLFCGDAGIGKRLLALRFAQDILCRGVSTFADLSAVALAKAEATVDTLHTPGAEGGGGDVSHTPGGVGAEEENARRLLDCGNHPDLIIVEPEKDKKIISVDAIRKLIASLQLKPFMAKKIVAIINNAHLMNPEANNALLKTLEEPLPAAILILITDRPHRLLETVVSRCQTYNFSPLTHAEVRKILDNLSCGDAKSHRTGTVDACRDARFCVSGTIEQLATDSLEPLKLHQFINQRTDKITDHAGLKEHLENLNTLIVDITNDLNKLLPDEQTNHNFAVSLAAKISENKSAFYLGTFMYLLRKRLQHKMLQRTDDRLAEALEATVATEQLILEANANMQLQLAGLLLNVT